MLGRKLYYVLMWGIVSSSTAAVANRLTYSHRNICWKEQKLKGPSAQIYKKRRKWDRWICLGNRYSRVIMQCQSLPDRCFSKHLFLDDASLGRCVSWTMRPLDDSSQCVPWTMRPLYDATLGRCDPWTMRLLDDATLGRCVSWTMHPLDDASLERYVPLTQCIPDLVSAHPPARPPGFRVMAWP